MHAFKTGVTVIVENRVTVSTLLAIKAGTAPLPEAVSPIVVSLLLHKNVAPAGILEKLAIGAIEPLHTETELSVNTLGLGFTAIERAAEVPTHPANTGITEMVAVTNDEEVFVALNAAIAPVPLLAIPIEVCVLVQLNVAPDGVLLKVSSGSESPSQTALAKGTVTTGVGLTVIV